MSNVIEFLESVGRHAVSESDYESAAGRLAVDSACREALLSRDGEGLSGLMGARDRVCCAIWVPD